MSCHRGLCLVPTEKDLPLAGVQHRSPALLVAFQTCRVVVRANCSKLRLQNDNVPKLESREGTLVGPSNSASSTTSSSANSIEFYRDVEGMSRQLRI